MSPFPKGKEEVFGHNHKKLPPPHDLEGSHPAQCCGRWAGAHLPPSSLEWGLDHASDPISLPPLHSSVLTHFFPAWRRIQEVLEEEGGDRGSTQTPPQVKPNWGQKSPIYPTSSETPLITPKNHIAREIQNIALLIARRYKNLPKTNKKKF